MTGRAMTGGPKHLAAVAVVFALSILAVPVLAAAVLAVSVNAASAKNLQAETRRVHVEIIRKIQTRVMTFKTATGRFEMQAAKLAATQSPKDVDLLKERFHETADAWIALQHFAFGPFLKDNRTYRIFFWPDKRSGKHLRQLLASRDRARLTPERFANVSVAIQGLGSVERLLFSEGAAARLSAANQDGRYRCAVLKAIAHNMSTIATALVADWGTPEQLTGTGAGTGITGYPRLLLRPGPANPIYKNQSEVTLEFFKSALLALEMIKGQKTSRALGHKLEMARGKRAEMWRSSRSWRNITINLNAAKVMIFGSSLARKDGLLALANDELPPESWSKLLWLYESVEKNAISMSVPLHEMVATSDGWHRVKVFGILTSQMRGIWLKRITKSLGISAGFNALDGDG